MRYEKLPACVKRVYGDRKLRNLETFPKAAIVRFIREDYLNIPYAVSRIENYEMDIKRSGCGPK